MEPTRGNNLLDLVFKNNSNLVHSCSVTKTTLWDYKIIEMKFYIFNQRQYIEQTRRDKTEETFGELKFHNA